MKELNYLLFEIHEYLCKRAVNLFKGRFLCKITGSNRRPGLWYNKLAACVF
jgi:hypothetical protein